MGASVAAGTYQVDEARFNEALELFRREQYAAARAEWMRADPAQRDARTQFYIAYAFYRQGWGRVYNDNELFQQGLDAANRAIALSPERTLTISDADLQMHTAAELKAELEGGLERSLGDFSPLRVLRERK
jgi:tetratricopeptide (TPR) repeat protein